MLSNVLQIFILNSQLFQFSFYSHNATQAAGNFLDLELPATLFHIVFKRT